MDTGTTVLIVDGHAGVREGLTRRLRRVPTIGAVAAAHDLDQAACLAREQAPDVVLYDPHTAPGDLPTVLGRLSVRGQQVVVLTTSLAEGEEEVATSGRRGRA